MPEAAPGSETGANLPVSMLAKAPIWIGMKTRAPAGHQHHA
jgi:hypothetical protein